MKGIIPANIIEDYGVLTSYYAPGHCVRTNATVIIGTEIVPKRDEHCLLSVDMVTREVDGTLRMAECMDVKVVILTDMVTGESQGVQMWLFSGTKDIHDGHGQFQPMYLMPEKPSVIYWHQQPLKRFQIAIPGIGTPFALHEMYDRSYTIQTWFTEGNARFFWEARHDPPRLFFNEGWCGDSNQVRLSTYYEEAFWSDSYWQDTGGWEIGSGPMTMLESGDGPFGTHTIPIPSGESVIYGGYETRALDTAPIWWASRWTNNEKWDEYAMAPG